jgi:hypothetical protein
MDGPQRRGVIAQLGERFNGIEEVGGSIPPGSTNQISMLRVACTRLTLGLATDQQQCASAAMRKAALKSDVTAGLRK